MYPTPVEGVISDNFLKRCAPSVTGSPGSALRVSAVKLAIFYPLHFVWLQRLISPVAGPYFMQESSQKITQYKTPVDPKFVTTQCQPHGWRQWALRPRRKSSSTPKETILMLRCSMMLLMPHIPPRIQTAPWQIKRLWRCKRRNTFGQRLIR